MLLLVVTILLLLVINLVYGSVHIPFRQVTAILAGQPCERESWRFIVVESRLPQAVTALLAGGALAVCGLLLQTAFRNPLADPSIFGTGDACLRGHHYSWRMVCIWFYGGDGRSIRRCHGCDGAYLAFFDQGEE